MCSRKYPVLLKWCAGFLAILLGGTVCGILGLGVGAYIGGNLAQNFVFAGVRGYEATSLLGLILGSVTGGVVSLALVFFMINRNSSKYED